MLYQLEIYLTQLVMAQGCNPVQGKEVTVNASMSKLVKPSISISERQDLSI
jgi:hypothetical protein